MDEAERTDAEAADAIARGDVAAALNGHQPFTERKPPAARADDTTILAREMDRLARDALPQALRGVQGEPGEIWLLAHDPERASRVNAKRAGIGMAAFNPEDAADVAQVQRNADTRARRNLTLAVNALPIGADDGEIEIAGTGTISVPAEVWLEVGEAVAGLIDARGHRIAAPPATCGDAHDDAAALSVAVTAELAGCSKRAIQVHMQGIADLERDHGQRVLPGVPPATAVYAARPRPRNGDVPRTPRRRKPGAKAAPRAGRGQVDAKRDCGGRDQMALPGIPPIVAPGDLVPPGA